jgi:hypothetical protein
MSLDYNYTKVKDLEALNTLMGGDKPIEECSEEEALEWFKTAYLCFLLMIVGVNSISEKNLDKVWARIKAVQLLDIHVIYHDNKGVNYTLEDLRLRIGYSTNVSNMTDLAFTKKYQLLSEQHDRKVGA